VSIKIIVYIFWLFDAKRAMGRRAHQKWCFGKAVESVTELAFGFTPTRLRHHSKGLDSGWNEEHRKLRLTLLILARHNSCAENASAGSFHFYPHNVKVKLFISHQKNREKNQYVGLHMLEIFRKLECFVLFSGKSFAVALTFNDLVKSSFLNGRKKIFVMFFRKYFVPDDLSETEAEV
jgi:hypothetical protein